MTVQRAALVAAATAGAALLGWVLFVGLPRWYGPASIATAPAVSSQTPAGVGRKIKAQLFYVAEDGTHLMPVEREVPYGEGSVQQAKEIVNAQIAPASDNLVSAVPPGTKLRALFITPDSDAYVDLSPEVSTAHPGGSLGELLTVFTIVQALTVNLPAVKAVQILIDGKQADTLAGHVDLRRPLAKNAAWLPESPATDSGVR